MKQAPSSARRPGAAAAAVSPPAAVAGAGHPGSRWRLPETGEGSVASPARRLGGVTLDALMSMCAAEFFVRRVTADGVPAPGWWSSVVFAVECVLLLTLSGQTAGMRLARIRVVRLDGREVGPLTAVIRTLLVFLLIPALFFDRDHRALHDRATATMVVRV